jgi:hypothetical protein
MGIHSLPHPSDTVAFPLFWKLPAGFCPVVHVCSNPGEELRLSSFAMIRNLHVAPASRKRKQSKPPQPVHPYCLPYIIFTWNKNTRIPTVREND